MLKNRRITGVQLILNMRLKPWTVTSFVITVSVIWHLISNPLLCRTSRLHLGLKSPSFWNCYDGRFNQQNFQFFHTTASTICVFLLRGVSQMLFRVSFLKAAVLRSRILLKNPHLSVCWFLHPECLCTLPSSWSHQAQLHQPQPSAWNSLFCHRTIYIEKGAGLIGGTFPVALLHCLCTQTLCNANAVILAKLSKVNRDSTITTKECSEVGRCIL